MTIDAQAYMDFLAGDYEIDGLAVAFNSNFNNVALGGNPVVDANGMISPCSPPGPTSLPQSIGDLQNKFQSLFTTGITIVLASSITPLSGGLTPLNVTDGSSFNLCRMDYSDTAQCRVEISASPGATFDFAAAANFQCAMIYDPTTGLFAASINGASTQSAIVSADFSALVDTSFYLSGIGSVPVSWINYFALYPLIDASLLPSLSVYGVKPPKSIAAPSVTQKQAPTSQLINIPHNMGLWR